MTHTQMTPLEAATELLLSEDYIVIPVPMANLIGLLETILLKKIDSWCASNRKYQKKKYFKNGFWWTNGSYQDWSNRLPCIGSSRTIQRLALSLEKQGLLISDQLSTKKSDRTKWYRVDRNKLGQLYLDNAKSLLESIVPDWHGDSEEDQEEAEWVEIHSARLALPPRQDGTDKKPVCRDALIYNDSLKDSLKDSSPLTPHNRGEAPPKPGAPPTQEKGCALEQELSQEGNGNGNKTKDSQSITLATKQDSISIREESIVSGKDKNSAVACDNSAFIGHGNIAPDGKTRVFNQTSGKWQSCSSDPWMKGCNPDRAFKQWVCDRAVAAGKKYCLADASGEIRNNFQRAGDLWEEYQDEQARRTEVEQIKQPVAEPTVAEQAPPRKNNQFQFYKSAIKSNVPIMRPHRERGIEWAKQQPNVALVFDDNGEVIDIEEF